MQDTQGPSRDTDGSAPEAGIFDEVSEACSDQGTSPTVVQDTHGPSGDTENNPCMKLTNNTDAGNILFAFGFLF